MAWGSPMSEQTTEPSHATAPFWTTRKRHYTLFVLCLVGVFNFMDRQILAILLEPIKQDLRASDTQMGLLTGVAFAVFYVVAGFPLARIADRGNRRTLIATCLAVWSLATACCGIVTSFVQLVLARMGVAGGQSSAYPASQSILADLYPASQRSRVIGLLVAAQAIGLGLGFSLGGWLSQAFNWRVAFIVVGLPGIIVALIMLFTVTEPPRGMAEGAAQKVGQASTIREIANFFLGTPAMMVLPLVAIGNGFVGYAMLGWAPAFFMRVHDMSASDVGAAMGVAIALGLFLGNIMGGLIADRVARGNLAKLMVISGCFALVSLPFNIWFTLAPTTATSLIALFFGNLLMTGWLPPIYAVALTLAPARMRAMVVAIVASCLTLSGGMGPLVVGMLNDRFLPRFGEEGVRYSLLISFSGLVVGGVSAFVVAWLLRKRAREAETAG